MIKTVLGPEWLLMSRAIAPARVQAIMAAKSIALMRKLQDEAVEQARKSLDSYVYDAPLPPNSRRTRTTYNAVERGPLKVGLATVSGQIRLNREHFEGFYYPYVLEFGRSNANQMPRPYWQDAYKKMRKRAERLGLETGTAMGYEIFKK